MRRAIAAIPLAALVLGTGSAAAQQTLEVNSPIERSMAPKESAHEYVVNTRADQSFAVTVQQQGVDVVVTVFAPDGKQILHVDAASEETGRGGSEVARVTALAPGAYRVRIAPFDRPDAVPAKYTVTLSDVRELTADERTNARSEQEIDAIEQRWEAAVDRGDIDTIAEILRSDGFAMGPTVANLRSREQVVAAWQDQKKEAAKSGRSREHTITEHVIRAAGDTAVSTGRFLITSKTREQPPTHFSGQFVHVWAKNDQGWKLVGDYTFPFGRAPRTQGAAVAVPDATLQEYAGKYRDQNATITLSVEKGSLMAQWSDSTTTYPKVPLTPISDTTFGGIGSDELTFVRSPDGEVREFIMVGDGPAVRVARVN
jgi:ketosteroid isomerase-like protein